MPVFQSVLIDSTHLCRVFCGYILVLPLSLHSLIVVYTYQYTYTMDHIINLSIPFPSSRLATIAQRAIEPNREPRKDIITRELSVNEAAATLEARFISRELKTLRVSVNSFFESLTLVSETMEAFDDQDE
ncbi:transcription factor Pcc1-domain-containing protein [Syncephalis plumigaleata]|nr:transcription factor Pcc1-domain-containing protein [Syncephalis plumigaleata]